MIRDLYCSARKRKGGPFIMLLQNLANSFRVGELKLHDGTTATSLPNISMKGRMTRLFKAQQQRINLQESFQCVSALIPLQREVISHALPGDLVGKLGQLRFGVFYAPFASIILSGAFEYLSLDPHLEYLAPCVKIRLSHLRGRGM